MNKANPQKIPNKRLFAQKLRRFVLQNVGFGLMTFGIALAIATVVLIGLLVYTGCTFENQTWKGTISNIVFMICFCGIPSALMLWGWKRVEAYTGPILNSIVTRYDQDPHFQSAPPLTVPKTELRVIQGGLEAAEAEE